MAELWSQFTEKLGGLAGKWAGYAAFGSFLLYLFGYLTLRFQLTTGQAEALKRLREAKPSAPAGGRPWSGLNPVRPAQVLRLREHSAAQTTAG